MTDYYKLLNESKALYEIHPSSKLYNSAYWKGVKDGVLKLLRLIKAKEIEEVVKDEI